MQRKGPKVTANTHSDLGPGLPADVAEVALISADTCAAIGEMSLSWWHDEVRLGRAPKPVIKQPRFTRWRKADVIRFWAERIAQGSAASDGVGKRLIAQAKKASVKAQALRKERAATCASAA